MSIEKKENSTVSHLRENISRSIAIAPCCYSTSQTQEQRLPSTAQSRGSSQRATRQALIKPGAPLRSRHWTQPTSMMCALGLLYCLGKKNGKKNNDRKFQDIFLDTLSSCPVCTGEKTWAEQVCSHTKEKSRQRPHIQLRYSNNSCPIHISGISS